MQKSNVGRPDNDQWVNECTAGSPLVVWHQPVIWGVAGLNSNDLAK